MRYLTTELAKELEGKVVHCKYNDVNEGEVTFVVGKVNFDGSRNRIESTDLSPDRKSYELPLEKQYFIDDETGFKYPVHTKEGSWNFAKRVCLKTGKVFEDSETTQHLPTMNEIKIRRIENTSVKQKSHDYYYEFCGDIVRGSGAERLIVVSIHDNVL